MTTSQLFPTPRVRLEPPTAAQSAAFSAHSNRFGLALYGAVHAEETGNFAISPASITLAFDMVYGGAGGETAAEMARVMGMVGAPAALHEAAGRVLSRWNDPEREDYELRVVNRLFGEQSFRFEQDYLTLARNTYAAPFEAVDFAEAHGEQRELINRWVAEQTAGRITDLLPEPSITPVTRLVVVNAVYFLGRWLDQFDPELTRDELFTLADGTGVTVPLMRNTSHLRHGRVDGVTVVEIPYRGDELAMTLIVPETPSGLSAIEARLTPERFSSWVGAARPGQVRIVMPRFELRGKIQLSDHLKSLGMRQAFDPDAADLHAIGRPPAPELRLFISEAFHQAFVKVDEVGTEAAAATAVVVALGGGPPPQPVEVRADRPFLFAIRDLSSGTILFVGRVVDPR